MKEVEAMEDNCLLSVIIPVYNMQDYLQRCVDSVLRNAIDGMQIILMDDGSTDESPAICDFVPCCQSIHQKPTPSSS